MAGAGRAGSTPWRRDSALAPSLIRAEERIEIPRSNPVLLADACCLQSALPDISTNRPDMQIQQLGNFIGRIEVPVWIHLFYSLNFLIIP